MSTGLKRTGAPTLDELSASPAFPSNEQLMMGPVAVIECIEEIPCNPCETACPKGAITVGSPITNLPVIDLTKCGGCGNCISACPGLAIYVKDYTYSDTTATVSFPFEYYPLPGSGDKVRVVSRHGEYICEGKVLRVVNSKKNNRTVVVTVEFPKEFFFEAVTMERLER